MTKTTKRKATAAGAKTEEDFALFAKLTSLRDSVKKVGDPMTRAMLASYDPVLNRGQFFQPQPFPKGFRRGMAQYCYGNSTKLARSVLHEGYSLHELLHLGCPLLKATNISPDRPTRWFLKWMEQLVLDDARNQAYGFDPFQDQVVVEIPVGPAVIA